MQEDPIARPASLPEICPEDIARTAATLPASQLASMLPATVPEDRPSEPDGSAPGSRVLSGEAGPSVAQRQPGMRSLSILETEGIPVLQGLEVSSNSNEEIKLLSALRHVCHPPVHPATAHRASSKNETRWPCSQPRAPS